MSSRDKILARRAKFMAAAITGIGVIGCGGKAEACLSMVADTGPADAKSDAKDTGPQPCLEPPLDSAVDDTGVEDSGEDTGVEDTGADVASEKDTGPMPCLAPPPDEGGSP